MGAETNLGAPGLHERIDGIERGDPIGGVDANGSAAGVITMKAVPRIEVDFGLVPRTEGEVELGANDAIALVSGVGGKVALHIEVEKVAPDAESGAEPIVHPGFVIEKEAVASDKDVVLADGIETAAVLGEVEADVIDPVVAGLEAEGGMAGAPLDFVVPAM